MFAFKSIQKQLIEARKENDELRAKVIKANSDIEYLAMMTDVELDQEEAENDGTEI